MNAHKMTKVIHSIAKLPNKLHLWLGVFIACRACSLSWYMGVHPLDWLGVTPPVLSFLLALTGWLLWASLLALHDWACLALSLCLLTILAKRGKTGIIIAVMLVGLLWVGNGWLAERAPWVLPWPLLPNWLIIVGGMVITTVAWQPLKPLVARSITAMTLIFTMLAIAGAYYTLTPPLKGTNPQALGLKIHRFSWTAWQAPLYAVQGNIPIAVIRGETNAREAAANTYLNAMQLSMAPPGSLWALPEEGALPGVINTHNLGGHALLAKYQQLATTRQWMIMVGGIVETDNGQGYYNSLLALTPDQPMQWLNKRRLVPFGETLPPGIAPLAKAILGEAPDFTPGRADQPPFKWTFKGKPLVIRPLICSEALYGYLWPPVNTGKDSQAHQLVVVSANLGWFQQAGNPLLNWQWQSILQQHHFAKQGAVLMIGNQGPSFFLP
jgi:hypothetical protein